jgi:hypothetical protein
MANKVILKIKFSISTGSVDTIKVKDSATKVSKEDRDFNSTKAARRTASTSPRVKKSGRVRTALYQNVHEALQHLTARLSSSYKSKKRTKRQSAAYLRRARKAIFKYELLNPREPKREPAPPVELAAVLEREESGTYLSHHTDNERIEAFFHSGEPVTIDPPDQHHHPTGPQTHDEMKISTFISRIPAHEHHGTKIHQWKKYYKTRQFSWSAMAEGDWTATKWKQERQAVLLEVPRHLRDKELCKTWTKGKEGYVHPEGSEYDVLRRMGARDNNCVLNAAQLMFLRHLYV